MSRNILLLFLIYFLGFFSWRSYISLIVDYNKKNNKIKKMKYKSFKEWFFYTSYKNNIPKIIMMGYHCHNAIFLSVSILNIILYKFELDVLSVVISRVVVIIVFAVHTLMNYLFRDRNSPKGWNFSRLNKK